MFLSKMRPIVIPQYEHGRLAGTLAQQWGNDQFDRPAMDFASFVEGVALHDWHYGFADDLPIIGADEADWVAMTRRGLGIRLADPIADVVMKLHLRRLCSYNLSPERVALMAEFDKLVAARLPETGHSRAEFEWADRITRVCDNVAFYFSFEAAVERTTTVGARVGEETAVTCRIQPQGQIFIDPWPFATPFISGMILGYQAEGYPEQLQPVVVPFQVKPSPSLV
ncbi:MAG: DUF3891 family protein [Ardenticatenaceae bacterium]|nr:DUF3891 family protein [Ardenticatenaceae bacterium]